LALESLPARGFQATNRKEADGAASALAFVAAGFGVAVVSEPLQKIPAKNVIFRDLAPEESAWVPVGAAWKPEGVSSICSRRFSIRRRAGPSLCRRKWRESDACDRSFELMVQPRVAAKEASFLNAAATSARVRTQLAP
jgi:DNA-binding transcriptional LysR family regulator